MKLGQKTTELLTGLTVTPIVLYVLSKDGLNRRINCQPHGINPKTGEPVETIWTCDEHLKDGPIEGDLPFHLIGECAEDEATGFNGRISEICLHINGCVHVVITPKGVAENGNAIRSINFDIRRVKGKNIPKFNAQELNKSIKEKPSPTSCSRPNR